MGAVISLEEKNSVKTNNLLKRLSGIDSISDNDPYWNKLFSFNFNVPQRSRSAQKKFLEEVNEMLQSLLYNTLTSNNFSALIKVFLRRATELESSAKCENKIFLWQTSNSLIIIRYICAFFAERLSAAEFANIFQNFLKPKNESEHLVLNSEENLNEEKFLASNFLNSLVDILCNVSVNELTLTIHHETIKVIITLLSTQLYEENVTANLPFLQLFMKNKVYATDLVRVLVENFLYYTTEVIDQTKKSKSESLVISLASSMWSAFQNSVVIQSKNIDDMDEHENLHEFFGIQTLASLSLSLLLSLVCYPSFDNKSNPYKEMLSLFQNAQEVSSLANLKVSFKLDFNFLYNRLCATVDSDKLAMLLLYMLLHNNSGFCNFVLSRINLENLIIPCIKVLNNGISYSSAFAFRMHSHQTYLALIVLLILSEDDFFCKIIHETKLKNITWYQADRPISEISLGGLIVLVFVKIIQVNTVKTRDRYLHTNSMAALANMSAYFKHLSPLVCQKLVGLLEIMTKRQSKLIHQIVHVQCTIKTDESYKGKQNRNKEKKNASGSLHPKDELFEENEQSKKLKESLNQDISALEEGIRNILEIINACFSNNLRSNTNLIYIILYKRKLFELYRNHPFYEDLVWNIYAVINHFFSKIEVHHSSLLLTSPKSNSIQNSKPIQPFVLSDNTVSKTPFVSVSDVLETIKKAAMEWPTDRLHKFADLKFKYIEDENTLDFFVPYVWRLVYRTSAIYFNCKAIKLYNVILTNESTA